MAIYAENSCHNCGETLLLINKLHIICVILASKVCALKDNAKIATKDDEKREGKNMNFDKLAKYIVKIALH